MPIKQNNMGLFNLFKKKTIKSSQDIQALPILKEEFQRAIITISKMSYIFRDSSTLKSTGSGRNEKMMSVLHSYAGMLGYLYEVTYKFGAYSEIVDQKMVAHYKLILIAMKDVTSRRRSYKKLADNWSDVLQSVLYLQIDNTSEGNQMKQLQAEIDFVTKMIETISGAKCKIPNNKLKSDVRPETTHPSYDKYSKMVKESSFNPFKITIDPSLQNNPALPNMKDEFRNELLDMLNDPDTRQNFPTDKIFQAYVFGMVESYFNNAGFVPKSTVDAIIEQCYDAIQQTEYGNKISSLDKLKYDIYYAFSHK